MLSILKDYESSGEELRIRCDKNENKIYITEKSKYNENENDSKREMEAYAGYHSGLKYTKRALKSVGFNEYVSLRKKCKNYTISFDKYDINITIANVESMNGNHNNEDLKKTYVEVKTLLPESSDLNKINEAENILSDFIKKFPTGLLERTSKTYTGMISSLN